MQDIILLGLGVIAGLALFHLPPMLWLDTLDKVDKNMFKANHPGKKIVYYTYYFLPFIWLLGYPFFVFSGIGRLLNNFSLRLFFFGYLLFGGLSFLEGVLEVITNVSAVRQAQRVRGDLRLSHLVYNESVRRVGLIRIGLISGLGLLAWLLLSLLV
jgi:hypothetical protein